MGHRPQWSLLAAGESLGLTGPNGCGKTTLINVISGFLRPVRGRVWLASRDITCWPPHRVVRAGIGRMFHLPRLSFRLTVEQNIQAATLTGLKGGRVVFEGSAAGLEKAAVFARFTIDASLLSSISVVEVERSGNGDPQKIYALAQGKQTSPILRGYLR